MNAWLALVVVDTIAVASFARCFTGPGELTAALLTLFAVHLTGLAARGGPAGIRKAARARLGSAAEDGGGSVESLAGSAEAGVSDRPRTRLGWWALGVVVTVLLPVGIVLGSTFSWVVPAQGTWHVAGRDLDAAWRAFSYKVAPVPELPGLVLATAWGPAPPACWPS